MQELLKLEEKKSTYAFKEHRDTEVYAERSRSAKAKPSYSQKPSQILYSVLIDYIRVLKHVIPTIHIQTP